MLQSVIDRIKRNDPTLIEVILDNTKLTTEQGNELFLVLQQNTCVKKVTISKNLLDEGITQGLCDLFSKNSTIEM